MGKDKPRKRRCNVEVNVGGLANPNVEERWFPGVFYKMGGTPDKPIALYWFTRGEEGDFWSCIDFPAHLVRPLDPPREVRALMWQDGET